MKTLNGRVGVTVLTTVRLSVRSRSKVTHSARFQFIRTAWGKGNDLLIRIARWPSNSLLTTYSGTITRIRSHDNRTTQRTHETAFVLRESKRARPPACPERSCSELEAQAGPADSTLRADRFGSVL